MANELMGKVPKKTGKQITDEKERLKRWLEKLIPDQHDLIDLEAIYDSSLQYSENKNIIRDKIKILLKDLKEDTDYAKAQQEKLEYEERQRIEEEIEVYNNKVYNDSKELDDYYQNIYRAVNKITTGHSNAVFIKGRAGIGKSYQIRRCLIQAGFEPRKEAGDATKQFVEVTGKVTEAYLYRLLYMNNGRMIWLKDLTNLLRNQESLNTLKASLESEDQRVLTKSSYSKQQEDLPDRFIFKGKIIFDYNEIRSSLKEDFEALVSRGDFIELAFSNEDMHKIMRLVAKKDWQKEVTEFLVKEHKFIGINPLNLRSQWKAFNTYNYAKEKNLNWQEEIKAELKRVSRTRLMVYNLIGNRAVRTQELKKLLLQSGRVQTLRTADRRIADYLETEEIYKVSNEERNFFVSLQDRKP